MAVKLAVAQCKNQAAGVMLAQMQQMMMWQTQMQSGPAGVSTPGSASAGPSATPIPNPFLAFFSED